jgi:hypothetical protein
MPYNCGEIYHGARILLNETEALYHHAYLVVDVEEHYPTAFVDLDPHETSFPAPSVSELVNGVLAKPRFCTDRNVINRIFLSSNTAKLKKV